MVRNGFITRLLPYDETEVGEGVGHSWKLSDPVSEARSGWLRCPHVLTTVPSFYGDLVLAVIAREQVCGVCAFPVRQLLLIWGGKMNLH